MWVISWYIFVLLFFWSIGLGIWVWWISYWYWLSAWISIILGVIPWLPCIWASLNFARKLIEKELTQSLTQLILNHILFILSAIIMYATVNSYYVLPKIIHIIFGITLIVFTVYKTILLIILRIPTAPVTPVQNQKIIIKQ